MHVITDEIDYDVVPMTKRELAQLYLPDLTPHSAVNRLMSWIAHHPTLTEELHKAGYSKHMRKLTIVQVALIMHYLGEP